MSFGFPLFLFALGALLLPIIIHLIRFRSFKTFQFSDTRFLRSIRKETSWSNKLKEFILLSLRLLALAALVFAFSKPFISDDLNTNSANTTFWLYLDNSYSMTVQDGESNHFQIVKSKVQSWIDQLPGDSEVILLSNDHLLSNPLSPEMAADLLIDIEPSLTTGLILKDLVNKYKTESTNDPFYIISDFQSSFMEGITALDTLNEKIFLVPTEFPDYSKNINIDSAWFDSPLVLDGMETELWVRLRNHGKEVQTLQLNLILGNVNQAAKTVDLAAETYSDVRLQLVMGQERNGIILIEDKQAEFDNRYYFSLPQNPKFNIMVWDNGNLDYPWEKVYTHDHFQLDIINSSSSDFQLLENSDLIVLADWNFNNEGLLELIANQWENGKGLLVFPESNGLLPLFISEFKTEIDSGSFTTTVIDGNHPIFAKVFQELPSNPSLPMAKKRITTENGLHNAILSFSDNSLLFYEKVTPKSKAYVFTSRLSESWSSLKKSELMVPILLNTAFESINYGSIQMTPEVGSKQFLKYSLSEGEYLNAKMNEWEFLPIQGGRNGLTFIEYSSEMARPGHYSLTHNKDTIGSVALNINKSESDLKPFDFSAMEDNKLNIIRLNSMAQNLKSANSSIDLWQLFAWLGFLFLVIESLVSKFAFRRKKSTL